MATTTQQSSVITEDQKLATDVIAKDILGAIEKEREQEIIARRYGLFDRKETLEQIGEYLGITRERVRQLEKATINKLKKEGRALPHVEALEVVYTEMLEASGKASRIDRLTSKMTEEASKIEQSRIAFFAQLIPSVTFLGENDKYYSAAALADTFTEKGLKEQVNNVLAAIKKIGQPTTIQEIAGAMGNTDSNEVASLASISKQVATLNNRWGLIKWPMVNPKNIRDKIYVILYENEKPMHFSEIAKAIEGSDFKRKNVTTQAIHNELIKDKRFVLVGRGIYALKEWGYKKGTVSDVIVEVLEKSGEPMHRDDIIKEVLKRRFVKETTILLNLQGKPQFKRVAKATYTLSETE